MVYNRMYYWVVICFLFAGSAIAQTGDSLLIHLKDGSAVPIAFSDIQKITFETPLSVKQNDLPPQLTVQPGFPNPSPKAITIPFAIASSGKVTVSIFDPNAILVRVIELPNAASGKNLIQWDGLDKNGTPVSSGQYFYQVRFNDETQVKSVLIVK